MRRCNAELFSVLEFRSSMLHFGHGACCLLLLLWATSEVPQASAETNHLAMEANELQVETTTINWEQETLEENGSAKELNGTRINGGELVTQVVPYQVSLQLFRRGKWSHFCGGSIISSQHVLTAAHCVDKTSIGNMSVVCGTLTWKSGGDRHMAVAQHMHPNFAMSPKIINDIAVVKVTPPFNLHKRGIGAIALGGPSRVGEKVAVRLTGWGSTTPTVTTGLPEQLQMLHYRTITNEQCRQKGFKVTRTELCALAAKGKGACVGDSGGPLVTPQAVPRLVGVVSYGTATCAQGRPDVYTRVSSFLPFINKVITTEIP